MVVVPTAIPVTIPDDEPIVAIDGDIDVHTPLPAPSLSVVEADGHTDGVPLILPAFGSGFTVTTTVAAAVPQLLVTV